MREGRLCHEARAGHRKDPGHATEAHEPDLDTAYPLSSWSKIFVTAAFCLLVASGAYDLSWDDPIIKHFPDFNPEDDPTIAHATFDELLRHSAGIANPVVTWLAPNGRLLVSARDFINLLNQTPTKQRGRTLRDVYTYSNVAYGLVVLVIERLSGISFADFVQREFLGPLKLDNTAVTFSKVKELDEKNQLAHSYVKLSDGTWVPVRNTWTDEEHGPLLGMIGMRSSARDMIKLISALLDAYSATASDQSKSRLGAEKWSEATFEMLEDVTENPFKGVQAMFDGAYWWTHCDCNNKGDHTFKQRVPLVEVDMPCSALSWSSYNMTPNYEDKENVLGEDLTAPKKAYHFNGVCIFGTTSIKIFPETRSAVVAFSSGLNLGDAAEFAALEMTQRLFDLSPRQDILRMVDVEVQSRKEKLEQTFQKLEEEKVNLDGETPKLQNGDTGLLPNPPLGDYVGEYSGLGVTLLVSHSSDEKLQLSFRGSEDTIFVLRPFGVDTFSYWPENRDEWLRGGWLDWDYYEVGLLGFQRDEKAGNNITAATWVWEEGADPAIFKRLACPPKKADLTRDSVDKTIPEVDPPDIVRPEPGGEIGFMVAGEKGQSSSGWKCVVM